MAWGGRLVTRRLWLAAGIWPSLGWSLAIPRLLIRREGDRLRISAPQIRFITGKALEQLKNGASVPYISQISLCGNESGSTVLSRSVDRFVLSFDIWEQKFSATRFGPPVRSISRLNVPSAEAWCLDELAPIPPSLTPTRPFWIKLDLRVEDPKEAAAIVGEPGINLTRLVEIFSRPPRNQQQWLETQGPMRLQDL
jgi:hypothetical protein